MLFKVSKEFTTTPGGRSIDDGPYSGEIFRTFFLVTLLLYGKSENQKIIIDLDGTNGYSEDFLEESFGGMIRNGYTKEELDNYFEYISNDDDKLIDRINNCIKNEVKRKENVYERNKRR